MIGNHFIVGFRGKTLPPWIKQMAAQYGLGGVILFDYDFQNKSFDNNIHSPTQLAELTQSIHQLPTHPLVFIDQEGGRVRRLKDNKGFAPLCSQAEFSKMESADKNRMLTASYQQMKELGIDYNLAPVIDLNTNPKNPDIGAIGRSFGSDPSLVFDQAQFINHIASQCGLGLCLKHFPGLGGATVNSHEKITDLSGTVSDEQLKLFYQLAPLLSGNAILLSHGILNEWEADTPCTLSRAAIGKIRDRTPETLLISDDIQMGALQERFQSEEIIRKSLNAGMDMVCIGNNLIDEQANILKYCENLESLSKTLSESRRRISQRKTQFTT